MRAVIFFSFFLFFCGCSTFVMPVVEIPIAEKYRLQEYEIACKDLRRWWTHFSDPNLTKLIEIAEKNNRTLGIAINRIEKARGTYRISSGDLWPNIDLKARASRSKFSNNVFTAEFLGPLEQEYFEWGFDAIWELDFFGRLRSEREAAIHDILRQEEEFRTALLLLYADVAKTYVDLCAIAKDIKILGELVDTLKQVAALLEEKYIAGLIDKSVMDAAFFEVQKEEITFLARKEVKIKLENRLAVLLGQTIDNLPPFVFEEKAIPKAPLLLEVGEPSQLLRRRPDIRREEQEMKKKARLVDAAVAALFPSFSLRTNYGQGANKASRWLSGDSSIWSIVPSFTTPIFHFGSILGEIDQKDAEVQEAIKQYEQTVLLAVEDVENALVSYSTARQKESIERKAYILRQEELRLEEDRYQSGIHPFTPYLESKKALLQQKRALIASIQGEATQLISLYKALGGGW